MYGTVKQGDPQVCLSFRDRDERTAVRVRFLLTYAGSGNAVIGTDPLDRSGTFSTGVDISAPRTVEATPLVNEAGGPNCRVYHAPRETLAVYVSVARVEFRNGESWVVPPLSLQAEAKPRDEATDSPIH